LANYICFKFELKNSKLFFEIPIVLFVLVLFLIFSYSISTVKLFFINAKAVTKLVRLYPIKQTFIILFNFNNNNKMIQSDKFVF